MLGNPLEGRVVPFGGDAVRGCADDVAARGAAGLSVASAGGANAAIALSREAAGVTRNVRNSEDVDIEVVDFRAAA